MGPELVDNKQYAGCAALSTSIRHMLRPALQDCVRSLLRGHVDGADDKEAGDAGKDRGVDDAQCCGAVDLKVTIQHAELFTRADSARGRGVMSPGPVTDEAAELLIRLQGISWKFFLLYLPDIFEVLRYLTDEADAFYYRTQIVTGYVVSFFKVVEADLWRIAWIGRLKSDATGTVVRVGLQDNPGKVVEVLCK